MNKKELEQLVYKQLSDSYCVDVNDLMPDTVLVTDLEGDSLDAIDAVMNLERYLNCRLDDDAYENIDTVQEMVDAFWDIIKDRG